MTRQFRAAPCAPLRVALFEGEQGRGIFEYHKPSSYFGQYGDERVMELGAISTPRRVIAQWAVPAIDALVPPIIADCWTDQLGAISDPAFLEVYFRGMARGVP
jgi:hypothetical protein